MPTIARLSLDPDDLLYLLAPMAWLGWLLPILVGASIGATAMMLLTGWRLHRLVVSQRHAGQRNAGTPA